MEGSEHFLLISGELPLPIMANRSSKNRSRGTFHLVVGGLLFIFELYLLFVQYSDWQMAGSFSTYPL